MSAVRGAKCSSCGRLLSAAEVKVAESGVRDATCPICGSTGIAFDLPESATLGLSASLSTTADLYLDVLAEMPRHGRWRRKWVPAAVLLGVVLVLGSGVGTGHTLAATAIAGLICDLGGAGIFATGLILSRRQVREMGVSRFDENRIPITYWAEVQQDVHVGLLLLVVGFMTQALTIAGGTL